MYQEQDPTPEFVTSLLSVWALKKTCKLCRKAPYCWRQMRPSLSLCEYGLANRAERNSKPIKVWQHRWALKKVPGTLRGGPNAVVIQAVNTWLGTWRVPNDSVSLQSSLEEAVHLPIVLTTMPLKHTACNPGGYYSPSHPLPFTGISIPMWFRNAPVSMVTLLGYTIISNSLPFYTPTIFKFIPCVQWVP